MTSNRVTRAAPYLKGFVKAVKGVEAATEELLREVRGKALGSETGLDTETTCNIVPSSFPRGKTLL